MALFTFTATSNLYGGVLWSGELQGLIIHEMALRCGGALYFDFDLFNAAWCVWTPQPGGTQQHNCGSVAPWSEWPASFGLRWLAPRLSGSRGSAPCAFPALSPTRFGLLVATKPHTSGGFGALRVPGGGGG
jgi:hypothetical protein